MDFDPNQTYYMIPAAVMKLNLELLNTMPRGTSNACATALEECAGNPIQGSVLAEKFAPEEEAEEKPEEE